MSRIVETADGRELVVHEHGDPDAERVLLWHHGSPQTGAVLEPVARAADALGIRVLSIARPGYGGSTRLPGRDVAHVAADVATVLDALGVARVMTVGSSGGGPHALATAALLPDRVAGVATLAGIAPYPFDDDDAEPWFADMADPSALRAALRGVEARTAHAEIEEFDPTSFVAADYAALEGEWASLGADVGASEQWGAVGLIDDDVAFARPWGFALDDVRVPALVVQGELDRVIPLAHGRMLVFGIPVADWMPRADAGHVSVGLALPAVLAWLDERWS